MKRKGVRSLALALCLTAIAPSVWGCGDVPDGKIEVEIVQYKPEAANYFIFGENLLHGIKSGVIFVT